MDDGRKDRGRDDCEPWLVTTTSQLYVFAAGVEAEMVFSHKSRSAISALSTEANTYVYDTCMKGRVRRVRRVPGLALNYCLSFLSYASLLINYCCVPACLLCWVEPVPFPSWTLSWSNWCFLGLPWCLALPTFQTAKTMRIQRTKLASKPEGEGANRQN